MAKRQRDARTTNRALRREAALSGWILGGFAAAEKAKTAAAAAVLASEELDE